MMVPPESRNPQRHQGRARTTPEAAVLERRLQRERDARLEAEQISERAIRDAFDRERGLQLLATVAATANEASGPEDVLRAAVNGVCEHTGWPVGHVYIPVQPELEALEPSDIWHLAEPENRFEDFVAVTMRTPMPIGMGLPGRVLESRSPHWIPDVHADPNFPRAQSASDIGVRAAFAFPVMVGQDVSAVLEFFTPEALGPDEAMLVLMAQVGTQAGIVVERSETRQRLEALSRQHELLLSSAGDGICGLDVDGRTTFVNPAAAEMLGGDARAMTGIPIHELVHAAEGGREAHHEAGECPLHTALGDGLAAAVEEELFYRRDGITFPVAYSVTPMRESGALSGAVLTFRDVSERRRYERQLRHFTDHDPLTDLFNRRRFEEEVTRHSARIARRGVGGAVLLAGLDNFKYVNDTFGHRAGDEVLRKTAAMLRERLRETDVLARLGGDEFAVLLPDAANGEAERLAEALGELVRSQDFEFQGRSMRVTASIGVISLGSGQLTAEEVMVRADLAMYQAKEAGRDRVSGYSAESAVATRERIGLTWVERIRRALEEDRMVLYGQPIYDLREKRVSQIEVLLRMRSEEGELVPPGSFLPTAERFGLIQQIDAWVVRESIARLGRAAASGPRVALEINLSGISIGDPELPQLIDAALAEAPVDPANLVFEITETAAIASMDAARSFAESLTRLGCRFALDDFGAGFGSFFYLKYLPLDYLKIDGEFIQNLPRSRVDQRMVRAMVDIAAGLGLRTIAEFVESEQTLKLLTEYGIDFVQGYHVGRPRPLDELLGR